MNKKSLYIETLNTYRTVSLQLLPVSTIHFRLFKISIDITDFVFRSNLDLDLNHKYFYSREIFFYS